MRFFLFLSLFIIIIFIFLRCWMKKEQRHGVTEWDVKTLSRTSHVGGARATLESNTFGGGAIPTSAATFRIALRFVSTPFLPLPKYPHGRHLWTASRGDERGDRGTRTDGVRWEDKGWRVRGGNMWRGSGGGWWGPRIERRWSEMSGYERDAPDRCLTVIPRHPGLPCGLDTRPHLHLTGSTGHLSQVFFLRTTKLFLKRIIYIYMQIEDHERIHVYIYI